jgi:hypothetical protein
MDQHSIQVAVAVNPQAPAELGTSNFSALGVCHRPMGRLFLEFYYDGVATIPAEAGRKLCSTSHLARRDPVSSPAELAAVGGGAGRVQVRLPVRIVAAAVGRSFQRWSMVGSTGSARQPRRRREKSPWAGRELHWIWGVRWAGKSLRPPRRRWTKAQSWQWLASCQG